MNNDVRAVVTTWLNQQGLRNPEQIAHDDYANLRALLSTDRKGFGVFISLMQFHRQQMAASLVNADLSSAQGAVAGAKMQGFIQCVDTMRELVLDIADPIGADSTPAEEIAGVRFDG